MKSRRRRSDVWSRFFWCTLFAVFSFVFVSSILFFCFSHLRYIFVERFRPALGSTWRNPSIEAVTDDSSFSPGISIRDAVAFPDQTLIFLSYPPSFRFYTKQDLLCVCSSNGSAESNQPKELPHRVEAEIVRCPPCRRGSIPSLVAESTFHILPGPTYRWDWLVYEALIDHDNSTVAFAKGLHLRPDRVGHASRYECVFGLDIRRPKFILRSEVISLAQEIVRCHTPLSILGGSKGFNGSVKVSVRIKGSRIMLNSVARPVNLPVTMNRLVPKPYQMCICTMMRNGARFLREWVMYHGRIGVQRWFIYDNNSDDDIIDVVESLSRAGYDISRHVWPWIKTQEAGFAHCAIRAREECDWVGFIDVDEFFHFPSGLTLRDMIRNYSGSAPVGELRTPCHSFGPSGLNRAPSQGVTVGYTCRLALPERHKSIVRPEAINSTMLNVVHHFHLRRGFEYVNTERETMVVNHYKYQVWEVFKEKFYRRVATYVADWQDEQNVGSKDRAPGLGTRPVEPADWSKRFCEVWDTGLRDRVMQMFADADRHRLPWQEHDGELEREKV